MTRLHGLAAATLLGLIVAAQPLAGQTPEQPGLLDVLTGADDDGDFLRITTTDSKTVEGYIRRIRDDVIRLGGGVVSLPLIQRVEVRNRNRPEVTGGAMTGAIIGGVTFGLIGMALSGLCDYCGVDWMLAGGAATIGALLGGAFGSVLGYSIDPGETEWTLVWER